MTSDHAEAFKSQVPRSDGTLTPDRMLELAMRHELFEFDNDLDGILATLIETPVYELYPQGIRFTGVEAVRAFYERTLWMFRQLDYRPTGVDTRRVVSVAFGDSHLTAELNAEFTTRDGVRKRVQSIAVVEFQGELMVGERLYCDEALAGLFDESLGEDFYARPDVARI
jgi:hypothetical protein